MTDKKDTKQNSLVARNWEFLDSVKRHSAAKFASRTILFAMMDACGRSGGIHQDPPSVRISKTELIRVTGLTRKTVMIGLAMLRAEGSIFKMDPGGGRGGAATYGFKVVPLPGEISDDVPQLPEGQGPDAFDAWAKAKMILRDDLGRYTMENWINHLGIEKLTPAEVILTAPTRYTISHIHTNLEQKISVAIGQVLDCEIKRIRYQIKP